MKLSKASTRAAVAIVWISAASIVVFGFDSQGLPDADVLLKEAGKGLERFRSLQFVSRMTIEVPVGPKTMVFVSETSFAGVSPGKARMESKAQGATSTTVSDGKQTYIYAAAKKQFALIAGALGWRRLSSAGGLGLAESQDASSTSKTIGEDVIEIQGERHDCWVVETSIGGASFLLPEMGSSGVEVSGVVTSWLDKKLTIDVRSKASLKAKIAGLPPVPVTATSMKENLKTDEPIPESMFRFTPPQNATQVTTDELLASGVSELQKRNMIGKDAPSFELKGMDGKSYSLASLKGNTVILDFWATWCVPCQATMPVLDAFYKERKDHDLIIIGVDVAEEFDVVGQFLREKPIQYPVVLSGDSGIVDALQITMYPTMVIIGPDGKIKAYEVGYRGEAALRKSLMNAVPDAPMKN